MRIIKDVLKEDHAESLRQKFINAEWKRYDRTEEGIYRGKDSWYPGEDEVYSSNYCRARAIEKDPAFHEIAQAITQFLMEFNVQRTMCYAYRMIAGDHFRVHDDSSNGIGFVYYLSKGWKWDWGGLLMVRHGEGILSLMPTFNQMVIIDYGVPHFVTPVTTYAKEARYAIVGFGK